MPSCADHSLRLPPAQFLSLPLLFLPHEGFSSPPHPSVSQGHRVCFPKFKAYEMVLPQISWGRELLFFRLWRSSFILWKHGPNRDPANRDSVCSCWDYPASPPRDGAAGVLCGFSALPSTARCTERVCASWLLLVLFMCFSPTPESRWASAMSAVPGCIGGQMGWFRLPLQIYCFKIHNHVSQTFKFLK